MPARSLHILETPCPSLDDPAAAPIIASVVRDAEPDRVVAVNLGEGTLTVIVEKLEQIGPEDPKVPLFGHIVETQRIHDDRTVRQMVDATTTDRSDVAALIIQGGYVCVVQSTPDTVRQVTFLGLNEP
jgi:hypothetical protein